MDPRGALRKRLSAAGIDAPTRAEAVVIDLAGDPPHGASEEAIAVEESGRVLAALAAAMLAARAERGFVAVRGGAAEQAIRTALAEADAGGAVSVVRARALWPSLGIDLDLGVPGAWVIDGERALALAAAALGQAPSPRRITVAGAVRNPGVYRFPAGASPSVAEAVAAAGGASELAWVALDGGLPAGLPRGLSGDSDAPVGASILLVLPSSHPWSQRARVPVAHWLHRAASACEGCRACTDSCPAVLDGAAFAPHEILRTLVSGRNDGIRLAEATACVGCGVCDLACPSGLSPHALVAAVKLRLPAAPSEPRHARRAPHPDRAGRRASLDLLLLRLGPLRQRAHSLGD